MTRRIASVLILAATLAALAVAGPARAATRTWRTCDPGAKNYDGAYRVYDNAWMGPSSKHFCVSSTGLNISIRTSAVPLGGNVVADPVIYFGTRFTDGNPQSGMPERVTRLGSMTMVVSSTCRARGMWQSDADIWFRPRAHWTGHGTFELVIANCASYVPRGTRLVRVHGTAWRWATWMTCQRMSSGRCDPAVRPWRIMTFFRARYTRKARFRLSQFTWFARRYLPRSDWLGDVAYGTELWSGGKGLTDAMHIAWPGVGLARHDPRRQGDLGPPDPDQ
jgi:hypothetical protein